MRGTALNESFRDGRRGRARRWTFPANARMVDACTSSTRAKGTRYKERRRIKWREEVKRGNSDFLFLFNFTFFTCIFTKPIFSFPSPSLESISSFFPFFTRAHEECFHLPLFFLLFFIALLKWILGRSIFSWFYSHRKNKFNFTWN